MKALARAVVGAFEFFEFCDDETLDPDDAIKMSESLSFELQSCSEAEKEALRVVCQEQMSILKSNELMADEVKAERSEAYKHFLANLYFDDAENE